MSGSGSKRDVIVTREEVRKQLRTRRNAPVRTTRPRTGLRRDPSGTACRSSSGPVQRASRGSLIRAEPIAALYEQGKVHHVGAFPQLEDQMCSFTADYERSKGNSPDRVDALVWALTELMVEGVAGWGIMEHYRRGAEAARRGEEYPARRAPAAPVRLAPPPDFAASTLITMSGRAITLGTGTAEVSEDDARPLLRDGWTRAENPA